MKMVMIHETTSSVFRVLDKTDQSVASQNSYLKVPKREIFDRSDFPDFYTIKSLRLGDFGVKIKIFLKIIKGFI
jgi:hypothetical protein